MKKVLTFSLVALLSISAVSAVSAATKSKTTQQTTTTTTKVVQQSSATTKVVENKNKITTTKFMTDIDCESCAKKIMNKIPDQKGVEDVKVDVKSKIVTVSYDIDKTDDATLIKKFKSIKISAKVIK
ncbi:MAG: heavy-metal-associated domain-containing protein [Rikenellaceae bacterium]